MHCTNCGAELEPGATTCPACGEPLTQTEQTAQQTEPVEQTEVKTCGRSEPCAACDALNGCEHAQNYFADELETQKKAKKSGRKQIILGIVAGVALIAIIAALLIWLLPGKTTDGPELSQTAGTSGEDADTQKTDETPESDVTAATDGSIIHTNDYGYTSYTATQQQLTEPVLASVVASCGEHELTNADMGIYYWQQYYSFANAYGSYLSYFMDTSLGLDEQLYGENVTWQQQFIDRAFLMFHHVTALVQEAEAAGFTLSDEDQAYLDSYADTLSEAAVGYGYDSADALLQQQFGPGVTLESYAATVADNFYASMYLQSLLDQLSYTDQDISDYYDEHAEEYEANRVQKLDMPNIDIRHILIVPAEENEDGTYTDEAWEQAQQQAEELLRQWRDGEATEDSFAALAMENSADGSASDGGLITDVYPGQMVDAFNDWCFDETRQVGDVGIVKSPYGYHVMYFSGVLEEIYWRTVAESDYLSEYSATLEDSIAAKYELNTWLDNVAIFDVMAAYVQ